jgi:tetratricopeptide (TPR) repeat protein
LPKDISNQKRDSLILRGLTLSKENNFDSLSFVFASKYARNAALEYNSVNYKKGLKELQNLYKTKKTDNFLASYNYSKGIYHHYNSKLDSSFYYLLKAKNYYLEHNYIKYAGYVFLELLSVQLDVNDRIGLEKTVVEALTFFKKNPDYYRIASTYQYQAVSIGDFDLERANKYFDKAIYYTDSIPDKYLKEATALYIQINKGYALLGNNKFKEALEEIKKGIELYKKSNYKENFEEDYYWLLINETSSQMGLGNIEEVYSKLDSVLQFTNKTNDSYAQGTLFLGFAEYHFAKGNKQQGIDYLKKSLELCKKTNNTSIYIDALRLLAEKTSGNTSRKLLKELIHLKDSLYKNERKEKDQYALVKFETEQKEAENSQLKQENKLNKANLKNERQRSNIIGLGALLSLLIAGFIYYIYIYIQLEKKNLLIKPI